MARRDTPQTPLGYDGAWGRCERCGKIAWPSRKAARHHVRNHHRRADPQQAYRCPYGLGWHLGHLPPAVRRGEYDRGTYAARADARTLKGAPHDQHQD